MIAEFRGFDILDARNSRKLHLNLKNCAKDKFLSDFATLHINFTLKYQFYLPIWQ